MDVDRLDKYYFTIIGSLQASNLCLTFQQSNFSYQAVCMLGDLTVTEETRWVRSVKLSSSMYTTED